MIRKKLFAELTGETQESNEIPDAYQSRVFWSEMWSESKEHNRNEEMVSMQNRKIVHWKAPGIDGVQGFWIKK